MKKLLDNMAALLKVKTIVTFAVMFVFCTLALNGAITPDAAMQITTMVVAFYFGTQYEKKSE